MCKFRAISRMGVCRECNPYTISAMAEKNMGDLCGIAMWSSERILSIKY